MKADQARQWRLLDLQALDTRLSQIAHRKANLPQEQALAQITAECKAVAGDLVRARMERDDIGREITKAETDVQLVRDRAARNQARLDAGTGTGKELTALQHELDSLSRRQGELEEVQLEVMERAEEIDERLEALTNRERSAEAERGQAQAARDEAVAALDEEAADLLRRRADVTPEVGEELLALYEKIRAQTGMGAAAMVARRCDGCRLELAGDDVNRIAAAAPDEVVRCEECRRILVRTADSGI